MDNNNTEWRETPAMMLQGLLRNRLKLNLTLTFFVRTNDMGNCVKIGSCLNKHLVESTSS